jgi:V8-like Glu-specific endopeptidase
MRFLVLGALFVLAAAAAFSLGRATADNTSNVTGERGSREFIGRIGDTMRIPSVAVYCGIDVEARRPRLLCGRLGVSPRYQVSLERNRTVVIRVGDPGQIRVFPER